MKFFPPRSKTKMTAFTPAIPQHTEILSKAICQEKERKGI